MDVMSSASSHERLSSVLGQSPQGSDNSGLEVTWGLLIRPQHRAVASPGPGAWNALLNSLLAKKHENKTAQLSKGIMEMLEKMALDTRQGQGQARRDGWGGFRAHLLSYASRKCYFLDASLSRVILSSSPAVTPTGGAQTRQLHSQWFPSPATFHLSTWSPTVDACLEASRSPLLSLITRQPATCLKTLQWPLITLR